MKKSLLFILLALLTVTFTAACAGADQVKPTEKKTSDPMVSQAKTASGGKTLIVYYSLTGNTKMVVEQLHNLVGGDIAEIQTVTPYPNDFHAVVEQAREERRTGFLPPIQPIANNLQEYDTIYLGYPVWGSTIPQPMATFLSQNNLAGKTVIPFCTHDGYGIGRSVEVIAQYCPNAKMLDGFERVGSDARTAADPLADWLKKSMTAGGSAPRTGVAETPLTITMGSTVLSGTLNNSAEAKEFMAMLPQAVSMVQYGGREYYGSLPSEIAAKAEGRLNFEDGDITYCPQNNTVAIFFAQTNKPNLTMRVIPIGKVTSDLSVFQQMDRSVQMTFNLAK